MESIGTLYLVSTPIGNLEDITLRAIRILKEVDFIAAEDTRHTLQLLNHLQISKPLISYYKQIENSKSSIILEHLKNGKNVAVVSDAGTPIISDPGETIVNLAINENIPVCSIPGPCALITALVSSGISASSFSFFGFLPVNKKEKEEKLNTIKNYKTTCIFYEAPHKLIATLETMLNILGDRQIVLARELTKLHEEFIRGCISEVINSLSTIKGEFVIIVEGNTSNSNAESNFLNSLSFDALYNYYSSMGLSKKEIIKKIAKDRNLPKNDVYQYFINNNFKE